MRQTALNTIFELAKKDSRVIFIGSDLGAGTLKEMKSQLPEQFFMEGISEQHIISFASGLAKEGYVPFINTIANFLTRRALEQIILDVALHNLPVKILGSGGGMVYAPLGPTHTATDDLAHALLIPNLDVFAPCDAVEMTEILEFELEKSSPSYIRIAKGGEPNISNRFNKSINTHFKFSGNTSAEQVIISTGIATHACLDAIDELQDKIDILLIHVSNLNFRENLQLAEVLKMNKKLLIVEEHQHFGGLLTQVLHYCQNHEISTKKIKSISLGKSFIRKYGSQSDHLDYFGINSENIVKEISR